MSAFDDFLKKYGKNASKQAEQDKLRNDFDSWLKNNSKNSHSGADTVQPPAGTQIGGYKSQNAAHMSSGLSRDDFDSSVRNRNQYLDLEKSIERDRVNKINADKVMTALNSRPGMADADPINTSALLKNEKVSLGNDKPDVDIPYYDYNSNRPETVIKAIDYSESTGKALESLKAKIDSGSSWIKYYESSVNRYADRLERLAGEMQRNPTAANYREYNSLYAEYQNAYAEYENQISEYNSYTRLYNNYAKRYGTATALIQEYNEQWQKSNKDFFEKSETGTTAFEADKRAQEQKMLDDIQAQNNRPWWQKLLDAWTETRHYKYAGERELIGESIQQQADYYRSDTSYKEPSDKWTESEKMVFGYLYSTDPEKAGEFATMINNIDNREKTDKQKKAIADWTTKNFGTGLGGTLAALILSPTAIADYADNIAEYLGRGQITEKDHLSPFDVSQAFTGGISEELNELSGTIDKSVPVFGGKGLGDIYSLGYSVAQSMSVGSLNFAPATLLYFFGQAAASGVDEKLAAGGSAEQALGFGFVAGAAEAICENIGIEHLFGSNSKNLLTAWLKQSGVEATEEGITSIINTVADGLIMMDKSQFETAVSEYQKFMSQEEAEKLALNDIIGAIIFDTIGGFVSGGADTVILAGANKVGNTVRTEKAKASLEQTIKNADAVIKAYGEAVQKYGENSPQAMELKSKAERAYIEKVRANLRLGMLNGKSTTMTTQERSEEEITKLVTQAQAAGDATAETGYYAGASDQLIKFAQQEKAILKQLTGRDVDIRFYQADVGENGHYDPKTGTIYVNVNSAQPFSYIEGHEFTHELENSAGYAEYAEWVKTEGLGAMYNTYKENIKRRYESRGINLTELELEQEVVATWTGENLFTDDTTMKKLIKKLSDGKPTLARKIFGGIRRFVSRSRSGITRNHYERALYLYQQMAQGKTSAVSSARTVNENAPTSFPAETAKVPQKQKKTAEAVQISENDIMISNGEAVPQSEGKIANDSEFTPAVRELVDRIADTARQIEASDQKGADYRRLKKEQKANLRALEQLRRDGKIDSVEYNRAIEALRDTTEGPEYGGIEESKANLQAQFEAGEIALEDYESAMAELEEVGAEENNGVKYSLSTKQADSDYLDAVNRGDIETAQRMVDEAAREAGYTVRAYHGTPDARVDYAKDSFFTVFDHSKSTARKVFGVAHYFTTNEDLANFYAPYSSRYKYHQPKVYDTYLNLGKTLVVQGNGAKWHHIPIPEGIPKRVGHWTDPGIFDYANTDYITTEAKKLGYDSVSFIDIIDGDASKEKYRGNVYAVFDSNRIKSADPITYDNNGNVIPLSERFNAENEDIRYSLSDNTGKKLTKEQKANLRALEQLRRDGKIDSVEYNRAIEALRDTTEGPEYGGIEESKANLQAQFEAGEIALEDYESAMAELEEVGAEESSPGKIISFEDLDNEYLGAVNSGDMETAQRLVEEAARKAGYTDKVYHGTQEFGFTEFDTNYSDDKISFFAAGSSALAQTYSGRYGDKNISDIKSANDLSIEDVVKRLSEEAKENYLDRQLESEYRIMTLQDINDLVNEVKSGIDELQEIVKHKIKVYADKMALDFNDTDAKTHSQLVELYGILQKNQYERMSTPIYVLLHQTNAFDGNSEIADLESKIRLMNELSRVNTNDGVIVAKQLGGYSYDIFSFDEARKELQDRLSYGNYALFGKPGNQLVIDGRGQIWNDIRYWSKALEKTKDDTYVKKEDGYYTLYDKDTNKEIAGGKFAVNSYTERLGLSQLHYVLVDNVNNMLSIQTESINSTRDIVRYAKKLGYDSVKFENIKDNGGRGEDVGAGDVYAYFNPNDLKSADTVTYDEDGNIIPLSERFNSEKTDIRFSIDAPTKDDVIGELRQYMSGARSKDQIRDVIAKVKKNPQSEIYGGPARRPQYSEGVQKILADAEREGMSVRDYISQNIDEFEVRGKLTEDARKALEISGDYRKFSVEDVRASRPPRSIEELDRILAEAEPLDPNEFRKTDFDRWYERREKEDQLREKMAELVMKAPDENEINTTLEELASDLENGYITPDAALEIVEGLRAETDRDGGVKYSISETEDGRPVVVVDNDILSHLDTSSWDRNKRKAAQNAAKNALLNFKDGVRVGDVLYKVNRTSRKEFTRSEDTMKIYKKNEQIFADKMRASENIDDVVSATTNWKNDGDLEHERDDNFVDFIHGNVLIQANVNKYRAETVVGITDEGDCVFYDVVDITPIEFKTKKESPPAVSDIKAVNNILGDSFGEIVPQDPEVVKSTVKKSVEDIEVQSIEESPDGPAMQNYNRLYEGDEFEDEKTEKSYQRFFPAEAVEYLRGKYRITNEQEAAEAYQSSIRLKDQVRRTELRLKISEQDKALALEILCGDKSISDIQNTSDKEGLLEYIAVLGEAEVMAEAWKNWKTEKRSEWQKEADGMYKTFDSSVKGGFKYDKKGNIKTDKRGNPKFQDDATNKAGYKYVRETQTRITYDIFADDKFAEAKAFNDWLFEPERASEAQSNRYKNKMRDQVRELKLGTKIQKGNAVSESAAVQILGELQDIIRRTKRQADMGNADTYRVNGITYNEAVWSLAELKKQNPNMDFSENGKIQKAVEKFGQLYAEMLSDMNQTLVRNGYPPVPARSGYFPHFADEGDTLIRRIGRALGIDTDVSVLPTGINGLTHTFKPGKTWFANALERKGHKTAYDAVLGFDKYIEGAANVIFHTDNIQRQRYFARAIRYNASDEAIKSKIDEIIANDTLNEDEKDLQIQYVTSRTKFRHSTYVVQLEDHTNSLAGKKTFSDRDMEKLLGRKAYTWMKNIEGRVAANMIAGNMSSALSNFIPLQYCEAEIGLGYTLQAMGQTIKSFFGDDGFKDRSDFLTNRYGSEFLVKSGIDKVSEKLSIPMEAIDHFTAQVLVRAAYNKYLKKGTSPELAMERANSFAAGVMADRSRGALPEIFNNKNPLYKSFTMFQVEVNNNLSHIFKDIPREYRDENKAKWIGAVAWILAKLFFGIWIFNETSEKIVGRRMAGTDVVDAANEVAGDLSGYRLPNTWDLIEAILKGEDISAMFEANKVGAGQAILNLGETAAEDVPFVSSLFGGGDLPVGSALPDLSTILPLIGSEKDGENIKQTLIEEGLKPVSYALLPFGANQASKIHKGISALAKGGSYKTNSKGEEILQYPIYSDNIVETAWDHLRIFAFGKSATDQSREWIDSGFKSLSARGTAAYKGMIAAGVDEGDAHSLIIDIMSVEPTDQEIEEKIVSMGGVDRVFSEDVSDGPTSTDLKCEIIRNADISGEGKAILYFAMIANESECRFISSMQEAGADMSAVVEEMLDRNAEAKDRKLTAVTSSGLSEDEQLWQIYLLDTSSEKSTHKRYYVASDTFGIPASEYRVANKFLTDYLDGNSRTQERVTAAIREYAQTVPLTKTEKAVLWQLLSNSTSAKNNPFDVRTGERVLTAINNYDREEEEFYAKYGPQPQ